ncbi:hypothetical protein [Streptomyces sp. MCL20-2]|uniref:hypothetical protein n=1 Tax=Streptomyces sp. MCL20-2 TaxID=2967219 RepID=UPI002966FF91|nr:hypothetical protein [Streptomyces sp. MCL20-2]
MADGGGRTPELPTGVAAAAEARAAWGAHGVRIRAAGAVCEDIWTYERVPGPDVRRRTRVTRSPQVTGG